MHACLEVNTALVLLDMMEAVANHLSQLQLFYTPPPRRPVKDSRKDSAFGTMPSSSLPSGTGWPVPIVWVLPDPGQLTINLNLAKHQ